MGNAGKKLKVILTIGLAVAGLANVGTAFSLTYSNSVDVSFGFNPTINVTISSPEIRIDNLAPGTSSDSNIVTVNVMTNTSNGYTLNATVGNNATYNTRDLKHDNASITNKFTSVDYGVSYTSGDFTDNTWAYAYKDGADWSNYSGLPLFSDTTNVATLKTTTTPVTTTSGDSVDFKIAAKASDTQLSGAYKNVINFTAVAAPVPTTLYMAYENAGKTKHNGYFKMQDMSTAICDAAEVVDEGSQMQVIDIRDNKIYWITKLQDGKCWMTQNLDHDISTTFAYTPDNTDIPANWTPDKSTYATGTTTWDTGNTGYTIQQSYDPGNKIWDGTLDSADPNSGNNVNLNNMNQGTNQHYHIGNYYNFSAAVATNDTSAYTTDNTDLGQSICPKGWTLPKSGNITTAGSFQYLVNQYNWTGSSMTNPNIWSAPLYFPLSGWWFGSSNNVASQANFWSSMTNSFDYAYILAEESDNDVYPVGYDVRYRGISVRCVSR